ncbi:MAG: c-type cytochrome [Elusimicrobiota bacterium]
MENKDPLLSRIFNIRTIFLYGNVILMVLFFLVVAKDQKRGYKQYQKEYRALEIKKANEKLAVATTAEEKEAALQELKIAKKMEMGVRQIWSTEMGAIDRCITCHVAYDSLSNPALSNSYKEHPYSANGASPALDIHKIHNIQKFGCVVCHGGQGYATEKEAAHGNVIHWEKPLLKEVYLQASCAKCHDNVDSLNINGENYTKDIIKAKNLFRNHGCIGCHQVGGEGGPISVDLKEETATKPLSRIDFAYTDLDHKDWSLANWIKIHFVKDPVSFVPGDPKAKFNTEPISPSGMPPYHMSEDDADALTAYILGMNRNGIAPQYLVLRPKTSKPEIKDPVEHGRWVFEEYGCAACHGSDARGGIRNYNSQYDVTPNLRKVVATYSREDLREKLNKGVAFIARHDPHGPQPPLYMPGWETKIKGDEMEDLITYLYSIKE